MNTCPQPWPPLINGLVNDALLELSSAFIVKKLAIDRILIVKISINRFNKNIIK